jgi:hypothetical protein
MPTINEVWEQAQQINANLVTLHNDLVQSLACCSDTNLRLADIQTTLNDGFTSMVNGLNAVAQRQDQTNLVLAYQAAQNQTIICILENISRNTCGILNEADEQTDLQRNLERDFDAVRHMFATANSDAALTHERYLEERRRVEACCPPDPRTPPCEYKPCPEPKALKDKKHSDEMAEFKKRAVRRMSSAGSKSKGGKKSS